MKKQAVNRRRDTSAFKRRFSLYKQGIPVYDRGRVIPYEDRDYDYAKANELGYTPDETGHMPTRDYKTGAYLKSVTHPTLMKSIVSDLGEGYIPVYNEQDGHMYSHRFPDDLPVREESKMPEYADGKVAIGHNVSNAKINSDGTFTDDYTRTFEDMIVTPKRTELKRGSYSANNWNYAKAHRKDWMKTHWPSAVVDDKPLKEVYPEFDLLLGGRQAVTSLAPKKITPVKRSKPVDKYALDWQNWSRGGDISLEHLKEYANIINTHKDTPNWLLMDDGSYFRGDPRSWVQLMSQSAKKAGLRERTFPSYTNIGYSGVDRKIDPAYSGIQWFSRNPMVGRSFAANDAHVLEMAYPWPKHVSTLDAGRNYWPAIFKTNSGRLLETNHVVDASTNAISPLEIKNVYELGPNFILKSKYKTPEFNYGTDIVSDDIILYPNYPRKSILYNNGDFDIANPNMYYKDGKLPYLK